MFCWHSHDGDDDDNYSYSRDTLYTVMMVYGDDRQDDVDDDVDDDVEGGHIHLHQQRRHCLRQLCKQ